MLNSHDPAPYERIEGEPDIPLALVCDHAGRHVPESLAAKSLGEREMDMHIACDVGARRVAKLIARTTHAPLVTQTYSRLVIDTNRPRHSDQLAPSVSDGIRVPFNQDLTEAELDARWKGIHQPYHDQIRDMLSRRDPVALAAIHSFTPQLSDGPPRPWHIDLISRSPSPHFGQIQTQLQRLLPEAQIGVNQVFQVSGHTDYTIPEHGETRNIPHVSIEIRNDLIRERRDAERFANAISSSLLFWISREFGA